MEQPKPDSTPLPAATAPHPALGLAIASLVLGIVSMALSFLLVGGILGLIGLVLGVAHLVKHKRPAGMARWGVVLSVLSLIASLGFALLYYSAYQKFTKLVQTASPSTEVDFTKWEGVMAPDISVTTLEGKTIKLSELKGKRVVLDFWASWCPPCVREIPHFIQLFNQTSRDDLILIGISDENAKLLGEFVKKHGINYPIGSAKNLPSPYADIQSIPTTFYIDRKGVIQTVGVGYHGYDDLKRDALAADFPGETKAAPEGPPTLPNASQMLVPSVLWSKSIPGAQAFCVGNWENDGVPRVLVAAGSTLHVLDLTGAETSSTSLPGRFTLIECGQNKENGARLLGYNNWGHEVTVTDHSGKKLWEVSTLSGVDGAHWGDLNGDGNDEMIVGLNGGAGLQAWSADGSKLWSAALGNVWSQAIVSATPDQPARVFATEAGGSVKMFDAQGKLLTSLRPDGGNYKQIAARRTADKTIQIAAINGDNTVVFDETGKVAWTTSAIGNHAGWRPCSFAFGDLKGDGTQEWAFIEGSGNLVIATPTGQKISSIAQAKEFASFVIASRPGQGGLLITLANGTVQATAFKP
ncbi:MAG: redoxin domain-containing protein [Verrucomicrobiia bacterium]